VEQTAPVVVFRTPVPRSRPSAGPHCLAPQASAPHPSRPRVPGPPARLRLLRVGRSPASAHLRAEPSADLLLRPPPQRPARAPLAAHLRALAWAGPASPSRHQPLARARLQPRASGSCARSRLGRASAPTRRLTSAWARSPACAGLRLLPRSSCPSRRSPALSRARPAPWLRPAPALAPAAGSCCLFVLRRKRGRG
jgi:hypothetical protein